jgi:hypothetical protein
LRRLAAAEVDEVADAGEAIARDFDAVFGAVEDSGGFRIDLAGLAVKDEAGAAF